MGAGTHENGRKQATDDVSAYFAGPCFFFFFFFLERSVTLSGIKQPGTPLKKVRQENHATRQTWPRVGQHRPPHHAALWAALCSATCAAQASRAQPRTRKSRMSYANHIKLRQHCRHQGDSRHTPTPSYTHTHDTPADTPDQHSQDAAPRQAQPYRPVVIDCVQDAVAAPLGHKLAAGHIRAAAS